MSENQARPGAPEYLEYTGSAPVDTPPRHGRRARGRAWWIGGGAVAVLGLGAAAAWAALGFFQQGAQPAEALPASTIAYLSVDLDPAGGQKIDAFRTLNKFPAFKDQVGVDSVDDIRRKVGESLLESTSCPGLRYDDDIDPWLGERAAVAAVSVGGGRPQFVVVVQVRDEDEARHGLAALNRCVPGGNQAGFVVADGWAVLAESQTVADEVSDATADGSLADDATYQKWTDAVGEAGVVNAYASPAAGDVLADQLDEFLGTGTVMQDGGTQQAVPGAYHLAGADERDDPFRQVLAGFKGGAATLRFTGDGLELAAAVDGTGSQLVQVTGNTGGRLVQRLPDDTAAAIAMSFTKGWLDRQLDQMSDIFGVSRDQALRELAQNTGLDVPADIETLVGSGVAASFGDDFDLEAVENSENGTGLPVAVTVEGDAAAIEQVLDKVRARTGDVAFLGSDSAGDLVVIGPSSAYRQRVLAGGHLGEQDAFTSVISDGGEASSLVYVDVDALEPSIIKAAAGDQEIVDNITPLRAIGMSARTDAGVVRFSLKVSTN